MKKYNVRRMNVKVNYNKLWKMLIDLNMKKYQLKEKAHISSNSLAKLGKNEYVSMEILSKISARLNCDTHTPKTRSTARQ